MLLPKSNYTAEDYWNLPEGERAELIDGQIYNMAPPSQFRRSFPSEYPGSLETILQISAAAARSSRLPLQSISMQMTLPT